MAHLLVHLNGEDEGAWARQYAAALPHHRVVVRGDAYEPAAIDYVFAWRPSADAFDGLTGLKAVLSFGAGVDGLLQHPRLPAVPIVRFVDPDLTQRMVDFVAANVLMHTRLVTRFRTDQAARRWAPIDPPPAPEVSVGVMGMGVLGRAAARRLAGLGFRVRGWSRTRREVEGVDTFAGPREFDVFLAGTDILVNLLPLTPETRGILNAETFSKLRRPGPLDGPVVINAARGGHQVEDDLCRALVDGTLGAASIDVFEVEPLAAASPLWDLPNCLITPHVAATSGIAVGVAHFAKIILEHEAGRPLPNVVDVNRGY